MTNLQSSIQDAGSIAARVLSGWRSLPKSGLRKELAWSQELAGQVPPPNSLESERIEVLQGAIESLRSDRPERVQAALYILEHLANAETSMSRLLQSK